MKQPSNPDPDRRRLLALSGLGVATLAGCVGADDETDPDEGADADADDNEDGEDETDGVEDDTSLRDDILIGAPDRGDEDTAHFELEYTGSNPLAVIGFGGVFNTAHNTIAAGIPPGTEKTYRVTVEDQTAPTEETAVLFAATEEYQPPDPDPSLPQLEFGDEELVISAEQVATEVGLDGDIREVDADGPWVQGSDIYLFSELRGFSLKDNGTISADTSGGMLHTQPLIADSTYELTVTTAADSRTVELSRPPIDGTIEITDIKLGDADEYAYVDAVSVDTNISSGQLDSIDHQVIVSKIPPLSQYSADPNGDMIRHYPENHTLKIMNINEDGEHTVDVEDHLNNEIEFPFESEEILVVISAEGIPLDTARVSVTPNDM